MSASYLQVQAVDKKGSLWRVYCCCQYGSLPPSRLPLRQRMCRIVPVNGVMPVSNKRVSGSRSSDRDRAPDWSGQFLIQHAEDLSRNSISLVTENTLAHLNVMF